MTEDGLQPTDPGSGKTRSPMLQPGYYPGFSTLDQAPFWDKATRQLIYRRVNHVPPYRFFSQAEAELIEKVCEHVIPQFDRLPERRIPIAPFIDSRLYDGRSPGYRFENMPPDGEAHRLGLQAIDEMSFERSGQMFLRLTWHEQDVLLESIHDNQPAGAQTIWQRMPAARYWSLLVQDCCEVYYAHPWSWDEIGFGGPAYPRGYIRLEEGKPEPWEVEEHRYDWITPAAAVSDPAKEIAVHKHLPHHGQTGTH